MKFKNLRGKETNINITKYLIDWNAKERSKIQFKVKKFLEPYWKHHVVCAELPVVSTRMTIDIINISRKIAVEIQGKQHTEFNKHFHTGARANYLSQIKRDLDKEDFCILNDIKLIEIHEHEIGDLSKELFESKGIIL